MTEHTDPTLAAIAVFERRRWAADTALEVYQNTAESDDFRKAEDRFGQTNASAFFARDEAFKTAPTTAAGAVALLRIVAPAIDELGHDPDHQPTLAKAIEAAAGAIERVVATPPLDPALVALAAYRVARSAMNDAFENTAAARATCKSATRLEAEAEEERVFHALCAAEIAVLESKPTTREGALRLLAHVADRLASDSLGDREAELAPVAIRAALAALRGEALS